MKFGLPLLMALSLLWHAAAWGDEWVDYATAVTVTDGYVCAGELYGDGTGTDIKCDSSNPYIADDGNVGIGTTTPAVALDVSGTLRLANGGEACAGGTAGAVRYSSVSNTVEYCNSSAWTSLGPSDTTPVAFYALRNAGHVSSGNTVVFNLEKLDTGNNFDTSTGLFTATYTGVYQFSWGGIGFNTDDVYRLNLYKNGADANLTELRLDTKASGSDYADGSVTVYMSLALGDTVSIYFHSSSGSSLYGIGSANAPYFAGHMVVPSSVGAGGGGAVLNDLTDVNASSPSSGEALVWTGSAWEPSATASIINSLADIGDVSGTAAGDGQVLTWDDGNSEWVAADASAGVSTLVSLSDVSSTAATEGQVLSYNDTTNSWEPSDTSVINNLDDIGDVSVSTPSDNNLLRYNSSTSKWEAVGINDGLSTTTMVVGWPDAIRCVRDSDSNSIVMYLSNSPNSLNEYIYYYPGGSSIYYGYNDDGTYSAGNLAANDCGSSTIATLYSEGKAFNFLGNNGAQISLTQIADVSAGAPTDGQVLAWDDSESEWVPADASAGVSTLVSLSDVSSTTATEGQVLSYNDTTKSWEPSDTNVINVLNDVGDVSASAIGDGQVLTYNTSSSKWEPQDAAPAEFSCPAEFTLIQNAGQTLGCMQTDDNSAATWPNAVDACYDNYGGRLPAAAEWYAAVANYSLSGETDDFEWLSDAVGISSGGSNDNHTVIGSGSITNLSFRVNTDTGTNYRCFIPASGQISMTTVAALSDVSAAAPQDGDTLTWNSSTEKWEAGSSSGGTPSGAVMAFNLASCPTGWSEYTLARGRFIRGIDSTGTNDPDGVRALGSTQDDGIESHQHDSPLVGNPGGPGTAPDQVFGEGATAASTGQDIEILIESSSNAVEGNEVSYRSSANISAISETRPINVALLYCEKD